LFLGGSPQGLLDRLVKEDLRREILAARKLQTESQVHAFSGNILEKLMKLDVYANSSVVALYCPFRNEVDLLALLQHNEKTFVFPKVVKKTRKLDFYKASLLSDFRAGAYGILEPESSLEKIEISEIDLFAVPGVAFSKNGERIGYGGGYYDCTLSFRKKDSVAVGIAYQMQIVEAGFSQEQDIPVDFIITEENKYFCNNR